MTFAQLQVQTFRRLREVQAAPVFWTGDEVATAVNEGYAEISDQSEWYERTRTIDLVSQRPWYDLRDVLGSDVLAPTATFQVETNRWLTPSISRALDAVDRRWEQVTGLPQRVLTQGLWWLGFMPRVTGDTGTVRQSYTALPPALSEDNDEPGFPEQYHQGLVEFACADLWAQDGETTYALQAWQRYLNYEGQLSAWVQGRLSVPLRRGYGADPRIPA